MAKKKRGYRRNPTPMGELITALLRAGMAQCEVCFMTGASRALVSYYACKK